ncbi:TPA: transposase domain-containing protein, partial [Escherichia coli]|nr:transposase domain-containing protein [Escherichia coli]
REQCYLRSTGDKIQLQIICRPSFLRAGNQGTCRLNNVEPKKWLRYVIEHIQQARLWICPYISRHLLSLNPLLACCRRYSRGER